MNIKVLLKNSLLLVLFPIVVFAQPSNPDAETILERIDANMSSKNRVVVSDMVINGRRNSRTISAKTFAEGDQRSMTEYLAPEREEGTKMLKLEDRLWIYSPSSDRTIQISGHMLKQSVMGSDLSYEDMMEDRELTDIYNAEVVGEENLSSTDDNQNNTLTWKLELTAKVPDVSYYRRMIWVDQKRYVPLKEELYAKSGQLLKKTTLSDVVKIDNRWFPRKMNYKDMLKNGKGTDFIVKEISFDVVIPEHVFSKGALVK